LADSDSNPGLLVGDTGVMDGADAGRFADVMARRQRRNVPAHLQRSPPQPRL
jgi:hypothetical protein